MYLVNDSRSCKARVKSNINDKLYDKLMIMYQCWFAIIINHKKCTTFMQNINNRKTVCVCMRERDKEEDRGKLLYSLHNFSVNLKLL